MFFADDQRYEGSDPNVVGVARAVAAEGPSGKVFEHAWEEDMLNLGETICFLAFLFECLVRSTPPPPPPPRILTTLDYWYYGGCSG